MSELDLKRTDGVHTKRGASRIRGYSAICLHGVGDEANMAGAMRAASCYETSLVIVSAGRLKHHAADTTKCWRHTPVLERPDPWVYLVDCVPVGVELVEGAKSLVDYKHPERAYYIFGPENGSLGAEILGQCRDAIQIQTKFCMNLAPCVNVVLYDRMAKRIRG